MARQRNTYITLSLADAKKVLDTYLELVGAYYDQRHSGANNSDKLDAYAEKLKNLYEKFPLIPTASGNLSYAEYEAYHLCTRAQNIVATPHWIHCSREELVAMARHDFIDCEHQMHSCLTCLQQDEKTASHIVAKHWLIAHDDIYKAVFDTTLNPSNSTARRRLLQLMDDFTVTVSAPRAYQMEYREDASDTPDHMIEKYKTVQIADSFSIKVPVPVHLQLAQREAASGTFKYTTRMYNTIVEHANEDAQKALESGRTEPDLRALSISRIEAAKARGSKVFEQYAKSRYGVKDISSSTQVGRAA